MSRKMHTTLRWFGKSSNTVSLEWIKQIPGVEGIIGFWTKKLVISGIREEIEDYISKVNGYGLSCEVVERVNVHEAIKLGTQERDVYICHYSHSIMTI